MKKRPPSSVVGYREVKVVLEEELPSMPGTLPRVHNVTYSMDATGKVYRIGRPGNPSQLIRIKDAKKVHEVAAKVRAILQAKADQRKADEEKAAAAARAARKIEVISDPNVIRAVQQNGAELMRRGTLEVLNKQ